MATDTDTATTAIPPIFSACCDDGIPRYDLGQPWFAAGCLWATDARILVRADLASFRLDRQAIRDYDPTGRRVPNAPACWEAYPPGVESFPLPLDVPFTVPCEECRGGGRSPHDAEFPCYDCDGSGRWRNTGRFTVGPVVLMGYYIALLVAHGVRDVRPCVGGEAVRFSVGVVDGLLMAMRAEETPRMRPGARSEQ